MPPYILDIQQSGSTLLQVNGSVITGALIFLTVSSIISSSTNPGNPGQEIQEKWFLSIITAAVITPFVVSALYTLVALYARTPNDVERAGFLHHGFTFSLIGFIYVPGFVVIVALGMTFRNDTTIYWAVIVGVIAVFVIAVVIGAKLRRGNSVYLNIENFQAPIQGPPTVGRHQKGEIFVDNQGAVYVCTAGTAEGAPAIWVRLAAA
jgi:hypothetical protein